MEISEDGGKFLNLNSPMCISPQQLEAEQSTLQYTVEGQRGFSAQYTVGQNPLWACPVALMYVPQWDEIHFPFT